MNFKIIKAFGYCFFLTVNLSCQNDLKSYKNSTIANEPTLKLNSAVIISKSKSPDRNDFVAYNYQNEINDNEIRIHKFVAKEGDKLQIIDGFVYVNNVNIDLGKNLIHFYKISNSDYLGIKKQENISHQFYAFPIENDSIIAMLEDDIANKYKLQKGRQIKKSGIADKAIKSIYGKDWNEDNFGPLIVPKNKIFVIGENRHNSEDSRYIGLIDISQIFGVIVSEK